MIKDIITGTRKVIDSGSVILFDGECTAKFTIEIGMGFTIIVEIDFAEQADLGMVIKKDVDVSKNYLKYTCYNFNNSLGTGTTEALNLATYNNKKVCMHFWSYLLGNKEEVHTRRIDYTFFIEQ